MAGGELGDSALYTPAFAKLLHECMRAGQKRLRRGGAEDELSPPISGIRNGVSTPTRAGQKKQASTVSSMAPAMPNFGDETELLRAPPRLENHVSQ